MPPRAPRAINLTYYPEFRYFDTSGLTAEVTPEGITVDFSLTDK